MSFEIYKRGQGYYTRLYSALMMFVVVAFGCYALHEKLLGSNIWVKTLVPAGLCVALSLVIFWLVIRVVVRLTGPERVEAEVTGRGEGEEEDLRRRAALAAVAVALAQRESQAVQPFPLPPTALVSTWQAVMRARNLGQRRTVR